MNKLALRALLAGVVAACGGKPTLVDGGTDAALTCDPIAQTGCMANEKCTWIVDIDGTGDMTDIGHIGCVANGTLALGADCTDGTQAGPDNCAAGELCIARKCKPICDTQLVSGSAPGACPNDYSCSVYAGVFESSGNPIAGVCEPACDPLTQQLKVGTRIEACGSLNPAMPSATCVPSRGFVSFHCAPSGSRVYPNTDRKPPLTDTSGNPFGNGCAPGYMPFYFMDSSGSMTTWCSGLCAPLKTDATIATGPNAAANQGDRNALGKLVTDAAPVAGHAVCTPEAKGASDITAARGQDCRFVWFPLAGSNMGMTLDIPFNDTLGVCFAYEKFTFTPTGSTTPLPEKSCAELPQMQPPTTDPYGSAKDNGCYPLAESMTLRKAKRWGSTYRVGYGGAPMARHIFD